MTVPIDPRDPSLDAFLVKHALLPPGASAEWHALAGGVSSDIWRADVGGRSLCVKRALPRLKVADEWRAPLSRNAYEWAWLQFAARHCPDNVPVGLAHDAEMGLFAMSFLEPSAHPVWKQQLLNGEVSPTTAGEVGGLLGSLHAASAGRPDIASAFQTIDNFYALRLEPYLVATAGRHPALAPRLIELVARTAGTQRVLVHGDVSPKNILVGPRGPVLLDAECAWYGDPAFDVAFCLNHLLLKGVRAPREVPALATSVAALTQAYLAQVSWEPQAEVEGRIARLLPALMLARVDGKSPVEYLDDAGRACVREVAVPLLRDPPSSLDGVLGAWRSRLQ